MNWYLSFKNKADEEAFTDTSEHQIKQRVYKLIFIVAMYVLFNGIRLLVAPSTGTLSNNLLILSRIILLTLAAIGSHCYRRNFRKLQKCRCLINFALGVLVIAGQFGTYPLASNANLANLSGFGLSVWGWAIGLLFFSSLNLLEYWWMGIAAIVIQSGYFFVILALRDGEPIIDMTFMAQGVILYVVTAFLGERTKRLHFLEERKNYKNHQAILKIFDDISQGIIILDHSLEVLYSNRSVNLMFMERENQTLLLRTVFDNFHVKKIVPDVEPQFTRRLLTSEASEDRNNSKFVDFIEGILDYLSIADDNTVVVEGYCKSPTEDDKIISLHMKFTQAHYMNKKVFVMNVTDTTERDALIAAEASSEYKSRLIASVSHELRTPLNATINFTEMTLSDPQVPEYVKQSWLIPAQRSSKLLLNIINDILDFSQMHAKKLRMTFERKNVIETTLECMQLLEIQAKIKGIKLEIQNKLSEEDQMFLTDHNRLKQVMLNLLNNAVKFTFSGGVTLLLEKAISSKGNIGLKGIKITCRDTGIGISLENQQKLFKEFEKIDLGEKSQMNAAGVGLGLVISNNLVQRLSPEEITRREPECIQVFSKEAAGSSFSFNIYEYLPQGTSKRTKKSRSVMYLDKAEQNSGSSELSHDSDQSAGLTPVSERQKFELARKFPVSFMKRDFLESPQQRASLDQHEIQDLCPCSKILIVDDDIFNLTALEQNLSKLQMSCDWAFHGQEALNKIMYRQTHRCCDSCKQYAVVFMDLNMPIMGGLEASKAIKEKVKLKEIDDLKVIACTAFIQESDRQKAFSAGVDEYCTKPISLASIQEKLASIGFKSLIPRRSINSCSLRTTF